MSLKNIKYYLNPNNNVVYRLQSVDRYITGEKVTSHQNTDELWLHCMTSSDGEPLASIVAEFYDENNQSISIDEWLKLNSFKEVKIVYLTEQEQQAFINKRTPFNVYSEYPALPLKYKNACDDDTVSCTWDLDENNKYFQAVNKNHASTSACFSIKKLVKLEAV